MSRRHAYPSPDQKSFMSGLGRAVAGVPGLLLTWSERSRSRHMLSGLDERLLKDIGVTRAQADEEARKPFWRR